MRSIGIGTSSSTLGITSGTIPNAAYFASARSARTAGGIAGYGSPSSGTMSISAVVSLPLTTIVEVGPPSERTSWCVITPSMSTVVSPPTVTAITTRRTGMLEPPVSRKSVCSGERFESRKVISKPLCVSPEPDSTFTSCTASSTARGTGTGTGPTRSWSRTGPGLSIARPRDALGQRHAQAPPDGVGERAWIDDGVGVGETPPELGVADVPRGQQVAPVALDDAHLVQEREALGARAEAPAQVRHRRRAAARVVSVDADLGIAARRQERRRGHGAGGEQLLQRIRHQSDSTPRAESSTAPARPARL